MRRQVNPLAASYRGRKGKLKGERLNAFPSTKEKGGTETWPCYCNEKETALRRREGCPERTYAPVSVKGKGTNLELARGKKKRQ